jgi:hypothetical protein
MQGFNLFSTKTIAGLTIALGYVISDKDGSKTPVFLPSLPAKTRTKRNGEVVTEEISISRTIINRMTDPKSGSVTNLERMEMDATTLSNYCERQIKSDLGLDVANAIETGSHYAFVQGVRSMLNEYDDHFAPESAGVTNPSASLCNFICATVPVANFASLTVEALSAHITNYLSDAVSKATDKANKNGVKPNGLALMREAKS